MVQLLTWHEFCQLNEAAQLEAVAAVGKEVVTNTAVFQQTTDMLSYHNQLGSFIHMLQNGYTQVQESQSSEWQQQTVTTLLMDSFIFQYLESAPEKSDTASPELVAALQAILPLEVDAVNHYLAHLGGYTQYQWQLEHFANHPPQNMATLMIEFLSFAKNDADVPYGRSSLIRHLLPTYFVERRTGQLNPRQDLGDLMRSGRPMPKPRPNPHPLTPDSDTLQRFLAKLLNYDPIRPYAAAAIFTLLPTWLHFLQARNLLSSTEATQATIDLAKLKPDLQRYFADFEGDDGLATAVANWPN